jgi:hypothetical protein
MQVSDVLALIAWFKLIDFVFQVFRFLVPEMPTNFPPYINQIIFIRYTWILWLL